MSNRRRLVLLYGGKSGEHEISLISAASVLANLDPNRYEIIPIGMDKEGCLFINDYNELRHYPDALPIKTSHAKRLESLMQNGRFSVDADVVFPVVHGPLYEDGCLQGLLQLANVAYVGSGVLASAMGMDKDITKRIAVSLGINTADYRMIHWSAHSSNIKQVAKQISEDLGWPLFIKPCSMGSSVGIHKAQNMDDLLAAIDDARRFDTEILVEQAVLGREIELAVLENKIPFMPPQVSVAGEICVNHHDGFYSYHAKYIESDATGLIVPAALSADCLARLQQIAGDLFLALKCKGMARVDFFVNEATNSIYLNEINTLPGFTTISMYPKLWMASGIKYTELLDRLIEQALTHHQNQQQLVTHYQ